jgi:hypothetical protein
MKTNSLETLNIRIAELEARRNTQQIELGTQFQSIVDNLKPMKIIKKAMHDVMDLPKMKDGIGNLAIGSITGVLAKKILWGSSMNPIRNILGILTQVLVTNVATHNADGIRNQGENILQPLIHRFLEFRKQNPAEKELIKSN